MYWCLCKWGPWGQHFKFKSDCLFAVSQTKLHVKHQCNLKIKLLDLDLIIAWTKKAIIHLFPSAKGIVFYIYCTVHNFVYTVQLTKTVLAVLSKTYRQIQKKKKKKMLSGTIWCEAKIHPSAHCPPELGRSTASTGRSIAWKVIVVSWTEGISLEPVDSIYLHVALVNFTIYYSQININFLFSSLSFLPCTKIYGQ